jgi:hypothetical protein
MEEWVKYMFWLGWILAVIGYWLGSATIGWIAIINLIIGIIAGIMAFKEEFKGIEERAIFYGIAWSVATFFDITGLLGNFALMPWLQSYFGLMAWIYVPAAMLQYIAKIFKEGY